MKKTMIVAVLALALVFGSVASAYAVSNESYNIIVPRFRADAYTSAKSVAGYRDFGVRHRYSGGYPIRFAVCNTARQPIGSTVTIYPGGATAPLVDLWYNATPIAKSIVVRLDSSKLNVVRILAQGTWVWNY